MLLCPDTVQRCQANMKAEAAEGGGENIRTQRSTGTEHSDDDSSLQNTQTEFLAGEQRIISRVYVTICSHPAAVGGGWVRMCQCSCCDGRVMDVFRAAQACIWTLSLSWDRTWWPDVGGKQCLWLLCDIR